MLKRWMWRGWFRAEEGRTLHKLQQAKKKVSCQIKVLGDEEGRTRSSNETSSNVLVGLVKAADLESSRRAEGSSRRDNNEATKRSALALLFPQSSRSSSDRRTFRGLL